MKKTTLGKTATRTKAPSKRTVAKKKTISKSATKRVSAVRKVTPIKAATKHLDHTKSIHVAFSRAQADALKGLMRFTSDPRNLQTKHAFKPAMMNACIKQIDAALRVADKLKTKAATTGKTAVRGRRIAA